MKQSVGSGKPSGSYAILNDACTDIALRKVVKKTTPEPARIAYLPPLPVGERVRVRGNLFFLPSH
jgi:hypothetical protein